MSTVLIVLHILVCVTLILVVLLQRGKGSDIGAALGGGGANTVFGSRGAGNFLTKMTTGAAIIFMVTSLSLSYIGTKRSRTELFDGEFEVPDAPATSSILEETTGEPASADTLEEVQLEEVQLEEIPVEDVPATEETTP